MATTFRAAITARAIIAALAAMCLPYARADITIPSADGSDGAFSPTTNTTVDLSLAPTGTWSQNNAANAGKGVYDASQWAVVFKYTSVNIPAGVTVNFKNNATHAPVVWLVNGSVNIAGTLSLDASWDFTVLNCEPGPGGFRGGAPVVGSIGWGGAGLGPGGGLPAAGGGLGHGSYATSGGTGWGGSTSPPYGNTLIVPLIGGSGGSGWDQRGGAGGGAIQIAASGTVTLGGAISASGSRQYSAGSGGAVRIIANTLAGAGSINCTSSYAGDGRIRLEANGGGGSLVLLPPTTVDAPPSPVLLWPPTTAPTVKIASINGTAVPADPTANLGPAPADMRFYSAAPVPVVIQTTNVDPTLANVTLRILPRYGPEVTQTAALTSGNTASATWTVQATIPQGYCSLQPRADPK